MDNVINPQLPGNLGCAVGAAVVNDQSLDHVYTGQGAREGGVGFGKRGGFVVAGDLDDQFQSVNPWVDANPRVSNNCALRPAKSDSI